MMLLLDIIATLAFSALVVVAGGNYTRPDLTVPTLTQVRGILALLEAPIISAIVTRAALPADPALYSNNGSGLLEFIAVREKMAVVTGRYDYGTLEYPFTLPPIAPDVNSSTNLFPPGRFHQDSFSPNANLTSFYIGTLIPLISAANTAGGGTSIFFHLNNSSHIPDTDAKYNLDATLLALLSHRASIGKVVGESKFAGNVTGYTDLIEAGDSDGIRALLTNTTQEEVVRAGAAAAATELATSWEDAQTATADITSAFVASILTAVAATFDELIDITTEVEIEYLLARLN